MFLKQNSINVIKMMLYAIFVLRIFFLSTTSTSLQAVQYIFNWFSKIAENDLWEIFPELEKTIDKYEWFSDK